MMKAWKYKKDNGLYTRKALRALGYATKNNGPMESKDASLLLYKNGEFACVVFGQWAERGQKFA